MTRRRKIIFALFPVILFLIVAELGSRRLIDSGRAAKWLVAEEHLGNLEFRQSLFGTGSLVTFDPYCGYRLREVKDAASRRPPRIDLPIKKTGEIRVLCVGDSTTYGFGLKEEQTYPAHLQQYLNRWAPAGVRFEVYNGGVPGYTPQQVKRLLQSRLIGIKPDIVIWREEPDFFGLTGLPEVKPRARLFFYRLIYRSRLLYLAASLKRTSKPADGVAISMFNKPLVEDENNYYVERVLPQFIRWCKDNGVAWFVGLEYLQRPVAQIYASLLSGYECQAPGLTDQTVEQVIDLPGSLCGNRSKWRDLDLEVIPSLDAFGSLVEPLDEVIWDSCHYTEQGAMIIAETVSNYLENRWPEIEPTINLPEANGL